MSLLTISSRHRDKSQTNTIIFHESKVISRLVPAAAHQEVSGKHGTRVTVNNLFGNMPVRIKHRASTLQRPEDVDKEWEELKRMMVALALSNQGLQKLRISDSDKVHTLNFRVPKNILQSEIAESEIFRLQTILVQFGLISSAGGNDWVRVSANTLEVSVKAYVALSSSPTKLNQFISLGVNPIFNAHSNFNILYNEINQVFTASSFGVSEMSSEKEGSEQRSKKDVVRGAKRWPMFYLRIDAKNSWEASANEQAGLESDRTLQHIIEVLHAMFYQFLKQHHYRPRKKRRVTMDATTVSCDAVDQGSEDIRSMSERRVPATDFKEAFDSDVKIPVPAKRQSSCYFNKFTNWSRVKSGDNTAIKDLLTCRSTGYGHARTVASSLDVNQPTADPIQIDNEPLMRENQTTDEMIRWLDPSANRVVLVNSRTGQCPTELVIDRPNTSIGITRSRQTSSSIRSCSTKRPQSAPARSESTWYESLVQNWANPVFSRLEQPIMSIESERGFADFTTGNNTAEEIEASVNKSSKLSRKCLADAGVIAQVDRKFILVRMVIAEEHPLQDSRFDGTLVLVDQHAADERSRLESLLSDMFTLDEGSGRVSIGVHQLLKPIEYPIQDDERGSFQAYSKYFESWGCHYKIQQVLIDTKRRPVIMIEALPVVISERCRLEPKLFVDLLRKEIWSRAGERVPRPRSSTTTSTTTPEPFPWLRWIAGCPEGIIDLISSRACRSSIMFNDLLSMGECESLISRLSSCAFPFQCAHGRPTMIPIVDEGRHLYPFTPSERDHKDPTFVEAFKNWQRN